MSDKVLQIVMDHWVKDDIQARRQELRMRGRNAFLRFLLNRNTILTFEEVVRRLKENNIEQDEKEELQEMGKYLATDLIYNKEIWGFCDGCNKGRVSFLVARNFSRSVIASCQICGKIKKYWKDVFEEGEFFA